MRAVVLRDPGGPENLRLEDVSDPRPEEGEVVVRLKCSALNHRDVWIRKGMYAGIRLPAILGSDGAGVVEQIGVGGDKTLLGSEVVINPSLDWGSSPSAQDAKFRILGMPDAGTYAELVKINASQIAPKPRSFSFEEAGAIPLAGLTAYRAVVSRAKVCSGETVVITGIGGGVSTFALQIAKALGAKVFVTSRSEAKIERAMSMGAEGGVNYRFDDWVQKLSKLCGGEGPDVVVDSVGGETLDQAMVLVRPGGRIVNYGATTGPIKTFEVRRLFWKQISLLGSTMGSPAEFADMLSFFEAHKLKPLVDRVFPLGSAGEAQKFMEEAGQMGKIVLNNEV